MSDEIKFTTAWEAKQMLHEGKVTRIFHVSSNIDIEGCLRSLRVAGDDISSAVFVKVEGA